MTNGIESITTNALAIALDAASLRHQAISANIANVQTQGYVPQRVSFEGQLENARRSLRQQGFVDLLTLSGVRARLEPSVEQDGLPSAIQLDSEVAHMAQNAVHYQALIKGISKHLNVLMMAASDGKK
jgi:flagellar basal-body rod protein FlgB